MTPVDSSHGPRFDSRAIHLATALIFTVMGLAACSTVKVKERPKRVTQDGIESTNLLREVVGVPFTVLGRFADLGSELLDRGQKLESQGQRSDAAGNYLLAAVDAHRLLAADSAQQGSQAEMALVQIENAALAQFAELWGDDPQRLEPGPYRLRRGAVTLEVDTVKTSTYPKAYFDRFIAAESLDEKGIVDKTRPGCGAALVGIREQRPERAEEMEFYPGRGLHVPVTLTIDSIRQAGGTGGEVAVKLSLRNPLVEQSMTIGNRRLPLAADFTAPIAMLLRGQSENAMGLAGFFKADERIKDSGIFLLEPYDPERIPVLLIHGLVSVPTIWRDIIPQMNSDPEISRRYQFMVFTYPSSLPLYQSSALLRENLAKLRAKYDPDGSDPLSTNMVVAGHSMGGVLTHTLVTEFGDRFWKEISDVPFEQVKLDPQEKQEMRKAIFFSPDPAVRRAVYFSAPHRGAKMAEKGIAGRISRMAQLPVKVLQTPAKLVNAIGEQNLKLKSELTSGKLTAVQSLEPGAAMISAMDASPYKSGVAYHSIIGDRGKGDTPDSSDGFVEYWSSRQDGAASELIVPTDHGSYKHPRAIEELRRILHLHAGIH